MGIEMNSTKTKTLVIAETQARCNLVHLSTFLTIVPNYDIAGSSKRKLI